MSQGLEMQPEEGRALPACLPAEGLGCDMGVVRCTDRQLPAGSPCPTREKTLSHCVVAKTCAQPALGICPHPEKEALEAASSVPVS